MLYFVPPWLMGCRSSGAYLSRIPEDLPRPGLPRCLHRPAFPTATFRESRSGLGFLCSWHPSILHLYGCCHLHQFAGCLPLLAAAECHAPWEDLVWRMGSICYRGDCTSGVLRSSLHVGRALLRIVGRPWSRFLSWSWLSVLIRDESSATFCRRCCTRGCSAS